MSVLRTYMCACPQACICMCVRARVHTRVHACVTVLHICLLAESVYFCVCVHVHLPDVGRHIRGLRLSGSCFLRIKSRSTIIGRGTEALACTACVHRYKGIVIKYTPLTR
jgi:hypothetical protein